MTVKYWTVSVKQVNIKQFKNDAGRNVLLMITDHKKMAKITNSTDSFASEYILLKKVFRNYKAFLWYFVILNMYGPWYQLLWDIA